MSVSDVGFDATCRAEPGIRVSPQWGGGGGGFKIRIRVNEDGGGGGREGGRV